MSYFAAGVVRSAGQWSAVQVSLADAADVEDVADRLRDIDPSADVSLLFLESDDTHLAILRLDDGEDVRVFGSDILFAEESRWGALVLGELESPQIEIDADIAATVPVLSAGSREPVPSTTDAATSIDVDVAVKGDPAGAEPAGDPSLLADL